MKRIACVLTIFGCFLCIQTSSFADSVTLPSGLIEIKEEAFYQDISITEVTVPDGARTIGPRAFAYSGLQKIFLPESIETIDPTAFDGVPADFTIYSPNSSYSHQYAIDHHLHWIDSSYNDFMLWMLEQYDVNGNGLFDVDEIAGITSINCDGKGFSSLEGIELFTNLKTLSCANNQLIRLDVGNNKVLTSLHCPRNELTSLDVKSNSALTYLNCFTNPLGDLDVSQNTVLSYLNCDNTQIKTLDVSKNPSLTYLYCSSNQLKSLNLSNNPELVRLDCFNNRLERINLSNNPNLSLLNCSNNLLTILNLSHCDENIAVTADDNVIIIRGEDIKSSYTIESEIGDYFVVESIIDTGDEIEVCCSILPEYSADINTLFTVSYGIEGNRIYNEKRSLDVLKRGMIYGFSKEVMQQYDIPSVISLCVDGVDIKDSYTIVSEIGDYFGIKYIIDTGNSIDVWCFVLPEYSADDQTLFTISYGVNGNCMIHKGISLNSLKRGLTCGFSKAVINQYSIPSVISIYR